MLARDITRRRTSESQLRQREDRLRKAENLRSLGQLAAGLAHEFNNILTTILGHADLLGTRPENTPHSDAIRDAGERMSMLVRQMMVFSGHRHHRPRQQMLNQTLAECLQVVRQTLPESVELEVDLDPRVHQVTAVRGDLERIVISLIDNARLAAGQDGTITVRTRLAGPERAILEVEDDGPGIPVELAQRVFDPFFTTRDIGEGSGLGLTAVYAMLQHAGGHIDVGRSANLGGARLRVMLQHEPGEALEDTSDPTTPSRPARVLLAEDDRALRRMARLVLQLAGFEVIEAENGVDASSVLQGPRVDILVTDVRMPGVDGTELAARLRARWPKLKVIFMSGYADLELPMDEHTAFLEKPFEPEVLVNLVRKMLR